MKSKSKPTYGLTSSSKKAAGDFYGSGKKNPMGKVVYSSTGMGQHATKKQIGTKPKSVV